MKPAFANAIRWASRPTNDSEVRRFFHSRLMVYFRTMGTLFGAMYVLGFVGVAITTPNRLIQIHRHPGKLMTLGFVMLMLSLWLLLRKRSLSEGWLTTADVGAQLLIAVGIGVGVSTAPPGFHLEIAGLLILVFLLVLRAALLPSAPARTALIGVVCSVPVLLGAHALASRSPTLESLTPTMVTMGMGVWCLAATTATTIVSHVIYGLVTQVREAQQLGQYTLREKIGEGGMGAVYRAEHAMLRRPTVVKLLLPGRVSPEALARFEREVQLTSQLAHPNTVIVYDYGRTPDGIFYYAMEYLNGVTLDALVSAEGAQPPGRVVQILSQIAGALAEAHGVGLIHRDIKPANIMLCDRGGTPLVKVFDFGLAKKIDAGADQVALTSGTTITGTPLYMAPESITRPDDVDARIDIYALGAVGYFLLTAAPPFDARTIVEVYGHHLHSVPEPPSARLGHHVPAKLESLILGCLAKDPDQRPLNTTQLLSQLSECQTESGLAA